MCEYYIKASKTGILLCNAGCTRLAQQQFGVPVFHWPWSIGERSFGLTKFLYQMLAMEREGVYYELG